MRATICCTLALAASACATEAPAGDPDEKIGIVAPAAPEAGVSAPGTGTGPAVPLKSMLPPGVAMAGTTAAPEKFGAPVAEGAALPLATVIKDPDSYAGKQVLVDAKVRNVCTKKGCWMELAEGTDKAATGARVTFKDYGFFVPKDCAGAAARVEGVIEVKKVEKAEADHLVAEGASLARAADGSAREIRIVATGVELRRQPQ
jgi:hypothetical protein